MCDAAKFLTARLFVSACSRSSHLPLAFHFSLFAALSEGVLQTKCKANKRFFPFLCTRNVALIYSPLWRVSLPGDKSICATRQCNGVRPSMFCGPARGRKQVRFFLSFWNVVPPDFHFVCGLGPRVWGRAVRTTRRHSDVNFVVSSFYTASSRTWTN